MITRTLAAAAIILAVGGTPTGCTPPPSRHQAPAGRVAGTGFDSTQCDDNGNPVEVQPDTPDAHTAAARACARVQQLKASLAPLGVH